MADYKAARLEGILRAHAAWLRGDPGGERAVLRRAVLSGADLRRADLSGAVLSDADLRRADLSGAVLSDAVLPALLPFGPVTLPDGAFRAYKLCRGPSGERVIATLEIPGDAQRVAPLVGRKCRASRAIVRDLSSGSEAVSWHAPPGPPRLAYRVGETVTAHEFDPDPRVECSGGIHFFLSRREAEEYGS